MTTFLSMTQQRTQAISFTYPYKVESAALLTHKPGFLPKYEVLSWPFTLTTWMGCMACYFLYSFLFYLFIKMTQIPNLNSRQENDFFTLNNCLLICYKPWIATVIVKWPSKSASKAALAFYCLSVSVLTHSYSGSLISSLTNPATTKAVDSIDGFLSSDSHFISFYKETVHASIFRNSDEKAFKAVYQKFLFDGGKMMSFRKTKEVS